MIKKIAYLIVLVIFVVITFMAMTVDKNSAQIESDVSVEEFDATRPDYKEATPNAIFQKELGN